MASKEHGKRYTESHWGIPPKVVRTFNNHAKGTPDKLVEMGKLKSFRVKSGSRAFTVSFPRGNRAEPESILGFSTSPDERLYPVINDAGRQFVESKLLVPDADDLYYDIKEVAEHAGGRQAKYEDRDVRVQPIGKIWNTIYATEKKGDGPSEYVHRLGEEGGVMPYLCVDVDGWLYIAGGSYTVPPPGITH